MYISEDSFEILENPCENSFEVDDLIAPAISLLNKRGYVTAWCCSGHAEHEERPMHAYISFWFGETPPETIPEGWYWESDGHMEYEYENTEPDTLGEEIIRVMDDLTAWAGGLPDLNA
jgi:hypothetical protein